MPIDAKLTALINGALKNHVLSDGEGDRILAHVAEGGVGADEVQQIVDALKDALSADGTNRLDASTPSRRKAVENLLSRLSVHQPIPLDTLGAKRPDGTIDWIAAFKLGQSASFGAALSKPAWSGQALSVIHGALRIDGKVPSAGTPEAMSALLGLLRAAQLDALPANERAALIEGLTKSIAALPVATEPAGLLYRVASAFAAFGALDRAASQLTAAQVDTLIAAYDKAPSPMAQALALRALDGATLSPEQLAKKGALEVPESKTELLAAYDALTAGTQSIGWQKPDEATTEFALSALAFAKNKAAVDSIFEGMSVYRKLNPGGATPWDAEERGQMASVLSAYVDEHKSTAYVFGTFAKDAPKKLAALSNAKMLEKLKPALGGESPSFDGVPLTKAQAAAMDRLLAGVRDDTAMTEISAALTRAADMLNTQSTGLGPPKPTTALPFAAFALFERHALRAIEGRAGTDDGMLDTRALARAVADEAAAIKKALGPHLLSLAGTPAKVGAIELSAGAAKLVSDLFSDHLRSEMAVGNIVGALEVIGGAHGGKIDGDAATTLAKLIGDYRANWPNAQVLDFNKLGRIASFVVAGKDVPLCSLNGQAVGLAQFYEAVGKSVQQSIKLGPNDYPWMPERLGLRAKDSVELLDVIAQMNAEGRGPIVELEKKFPGKAITVLASGRAGAHEQFIYEVKGVGRFNQGSDGKIAKYPSDGKPILFTATVRKDGAFDVKAPAPGTSPVTTWPIQTTYAVGDSIDIRFHDPQAAEAQEKGKKFSTQHGILAARIVSFDAAGKYTVRYKKPDGTECDAELSMKEIRLNNNPHHFTLNGSVYSDVKIDQKHPALAKFLSDSQPIIDKYLPNDGSLLGVARNEIAKRQRACVAELMAYTRKLVSYPKDKDANPDDASKKYHELIDGLKSWESTPLGKLIELGRGVCRHQCILEQLLLQRAGIDSRLASGVANTTSGDFRGLHIWVEISTADDARYLSDQTWNDAAIALWGGAYDVDKRRVEMYSRTARYDAQIVG